MNDVQPLKFICSLIADCPHSTPIWKDTGYVVLRNHNIRNGKLDLSNPSFTDEASFIGRNRRAKPSPGDIVITREAPMGDVCMIPEGLECCLGQRQVLLRPDPALTIPRFVLYALQSEAVKHQISWNEGTGSTVSNLRIPALEALLVPTPSLKEQRAIAHILGTLDDKIELNRKQNETLEAMARALFKAWFVDFEPVRAKMEGRWRRGQSLPGLPAHLYDLFPDRLVDSELGEIPDGWVILPANQLIEFNPVEPLRKGEKAPYIEMALLPTSGSWPEPYVSRPFGSGMRFRNGDTLLARITPCLENGKTAFIQCLPDGELGWGSTEYIVMRPKAPVPPEFGYLLARDVAFRDQAIRSMTGTSGRQRVQADSVAAFKLVAPVHNAVWDAFSCMVAPAFKIIKANALITETISQLRDNLLPKLVSGELRVKVQPIESGTP